ncbi:sensor histidine kinase [Aquimarina sediminis]|uniref:sensor histidine kinase n=1 Tax=Aquimarina sediminis TaxID=2070536 RepID=UPI000CA01A0B|nr:ATP-binding protein [Aquimarina sediminis]
MKLSIVFKIFQITIIITLLINVILTLLLQKNHIKQQKAENVRYKSYVIAEELKQSSDDLTRYCRSYVLTGDNKWENKYWEVLDIRNGKLPRPDGKTIALVDSMKKLGFTKSEFDKLKVAENNSNELVWTEKVALNAIKGLFDDGNGNFSVKANPNLEMARRIMFDEKYHEDKKLIMAPIHDFFEMLDKRTHDTVLKYKVFNSNLLRVIIGLIVLILTIGVVSFFIVLKNIIQKMKVLEVSNKLIMTKNDELSRFTYIASHDLQEPLNTIISFSKLLKEGYYEKLEGIGQKSIEIIDNSTMRMRSLTTDLLEYSRIGKKAKPEKINVNVLIANIELDLTELIKKNKAIISYDNLSEIVAYRNELRMLFLNLICNAIKYRKDTIVPQIRIEFEEGTYEYTYAVIDNGIGIDMKFRHKIFEVFQRLHTNDHYSGTGIGLANCKRIVELHKGEIWVRSEINKGSTFLFTIKKNLINE